MMGKKKALQSAVRAIAQLQAMLHRLQCSESSSSEGDEHGNEDAAQLSINGRSPAAHEREHTAFMPLAPVVGTDGARYAKISVPIIYNWIAIRHRSCTLEAFYSSWIWQSC